MSFLALLACTGPKGGESVLEDTGYAYVETGSVTDDTGTTTPTESTVDSETGKESTPDDTAPPPPAWIGLAAYPDGLTVNPGASFQARAVGTDPDGRRQDADATWTSLDEDILLVTTDGVVTAIEPGRARVRAELDGLEATLEVTVDDAMLAEITVIDATTGLPVQRARVALPSTEGERTDAAGLARLPVPDGLPLVFSVWVDDTWDAVTYAGVVNRRFTVPLFPKDTAADDARVHGTVDFASVADAAWDELVLGLAAPTHRGGLGSLSLDDWFGDERAITVFGIEADLPSNLVVEGSADDFWVGARPGPAGAWVAAGPIAVADVTEGTESAGAAVALLVSHLDAMRWGWAGGAEAALGTDAELSVTPTDAFALTTIAAVPALPEGFTGAEDVLVLRAEERTDEGWVVTGFGLGAGAVVTVAHVAPDGVADALGTGLVAVAQAGGLGSTGGISVASGWVDGDGNGRLVDFPELPAVAWDGRTRELAVHVDGDSTLVHVLLTDAHQLRHHLYAAGDWTGTLPNAMAGFGAARASVDVGSLDTETDTFDALAGAGALDPGELDTRGSAHTRQE